MGRNALFVDVGANIGGCALWAARFMTGLEVVAVEPHGAATQALNKTVNDLALSHRLHVVRACVREEGGAMQLRRVMPSDHASWSTLQVKWQLEERSFDMDPRQEIVPCRRLDEII